MPEPFLTNLFVSPMLQWETGEDALCAALLEDAKAARPGARDLGAEYAELTCLDPGNPINAAVLDLLHRAISRFLDLNAGKAVEVPPYQVAGVARILNTGDFVSLRDTSRKDLSGALYLDVGDGADAELNGFLEFIDPRVGVKMLPGKKQSVTARVTPKAGLLLLYPSWFKRVIYPYEGQRPRILVDFDVRFGPPEEDER